MPGPAQLTALTRAIGSIIVGISLVILGNGLLGTVVSLQMASGSYTRLEAGVILGAYYIGLTAGARLIVGLIRRVGHIRAFSTMAAAASASALLLPMLPQAVSWIVLRAIGGVAMAGVFAAVESWLGARATAGAGTRGAILAVYMVAVQLALAGGQLLVPVYDAAHEPFVIAAALYALGLIPIALTRIDQPPPPPARRLGLRALLRAVPLGVTGCGIAGAVTSALLTLGPLYAVTRVAAGAADAAAVVDMGAATDDAALFVLVVSGCGLLLQWPLGRLSDRVGRRPVLVGVCVALAGTSVAVAAAPADLTAVWLAGGGVLGALAFVIYPLALAHTGDTVSGDDAVAASGSLIVAFGIGAAIGPPAGTAAMAAVGPDGLFYWTGAAAGALAVVVLYRQIRHQVPDVIRRFVVVSMPQAAPTGDLENRAARERPAGSDPAAPVGTDPATTGSDPDPAGAKS